MTRLPHTPPPPPAPNHTQAAARISRASPRWHAKYRRDDGGARRERAGRHPHHRDHRILLPLSKSVDASAYLAPTSRPAGDCRASWSVARRFNDTGSPTAMLFERKPLAARSVRGETPALTVAVAREPEPLRRPATLGNEVHLYMQRTASTQGTQEESTPMLLLSSSNQSVLSASTGGKRRWMLTTRLVQRRVRTQQFGQHGRHSCQQNCK